MSLAKLTALAGPALSDASPQLAGECLLLAGELGKELLDLLWERNGFYAFESALHVFPADESRRLVGISQWNAQTLWRAEYDGLADGCLFFAQDLVGGQFCIYQSAVCKFDPETGAKERLAGSIESWCATVVDDFKAQTLWALAHEWQARNGPLKPGVRLVPKTPFVLGGDYTTENLYVAEAMKAMRFYADLAKQLRDLPDGARVRLKSVD